MSQKVGQSVCLQGQGDSVSVLITPMNHGITRLINLLLKPDIPSALLEARKALVVTFSVAVKFNLPVHSPEFVEWCFWGMTHYSPRRTVKVTCWILLRILRYTPHSRAGVAEAWRWRHQRGGGRIYWVAGTESKPYEILYVPIVET